MSKSQAPSGSWAGTIVCFAFPLLPFLLLVAFLLLWPGGASPEVVATAPSVRGDAPSSGMTLMLGGLSFSLPSLLAVAFWAGFFEVLACATSTRLPLALRDAMLEAITKHKRSDHPAVVREHLSSSLFRRAITT